MKGVFPLAPELLLLGARPIGAPDGSQPSTAIAIQGGRVAAAGPSEQLGHLPAKRTLDLEGKFVAPGFIDAHSHLLFYSMALRYVDCRLPLNADLDEVLERIRRRAEEVGPGEWVRGWGFPDYKVRQRRFPTRAELDVVAPANPVALLHASWHSAVVNSRALELMGVRSDTPDPEGGKIERDPKTTEPTGLLHESAMGTVSFETMIKEFVQLPPEEQMAALSLGSTEFARAGITTSCDAMCMPSLVAVYREAEQRGILKNRVAAMSYYDWCFPNLPQDRLSRFGDGLVKAGPIKLTGDGSLSGRTAAVTQPFVGTRDRGLLYRDQGSLDRIVRELDAQGYQIAIHAIGDRAVEQAIKAYSRVISKGNPRRHRIEHGGILNLQLVESMEALSLVVATQPRMLYEQGDGFLRSCGERRMRWVYPYRALIEHHLHVAGSSDCPVVSPDPILGMRDAVLRKTEQGRVLAPSQRLGVSQALRMFTYDAAYSIFEEEQLGSWGEGKAADLVVLSADPFTIPPEDWDRKVQVEMTVVRGEIVFAR